MKLYEISDAMQRLADTVDDTIDVQPELAALQMQFADKAQNIAALIRNLEERRANQSRQYLTS